MQTQTRTTETEKISVIPTFRKTYLAVSGSFHLSVYMTPFCLDQTFSHILLLELIIFIAFFSHSYDYFGLYKQLLSCSQLIALIVALISKCSVLTTPLKNLKVSTFVYCSTPQPGGKKINKIVLLVPLTCFG